MSIAKDELFCRLAIRQGVFSKEQATEVLRRYRTEGKTAEEISDFAVREGYLQRKLARSILGAIEQRASGHVAGTKRRVPRRADSPAPEPRGVHQKTRRGGRALSRVRARRAGSSRVSGREPAASRHVLPPQAPLRRKSALSGAQISGVAIGGVVLIAALLFLLMELQGGNSTLEPGPGVQRSPHETPAKVAEFAPSQATSRPKAQELSGDDLEKLRDRMHISITTARQDMGDGRLFRALAQLKRTREELGGDRLPEAVRTEIDTEIQELETLRRERFDRLLDDLEAARAAGTNDVIQQILDDIEQACGPDLRKEAENPSKSDPPPKR